MKRNEQDAQAVIVEVTAGNVRNSHINLRGAFGLFPDDSLGGPRATEAGKSVTVRFGGNTIRTDIDQTKAIFRERGAVRKLFEDEKVVAGDLILIERNAARSYSVSKASKRAFKYHL